MRPTVSESLAPCSARLATSRPYWSLPRTKRAPGGWSASRGAVLIGSRGLSHGAAAAIEASRHKITRPRTAPRWRMSRRHAPGRLAESDSGIDVSIGDVDQDVDQHVGGGDEQHGALHEREVLREDAADDEAAETGPAEDGLDDDRAGQEIAKLQAEDRDHRNERVLQGVAHHDAPPRQALGARGPHVVLAEHLEQARAREARDDRRGDHSQGHAR